MLRYSTIIYFFSAIALVSFGHGEIRGETTGGSEQDSLADSYLDTSTLDDTQLDALIEGDDLGEKISPWSKEFTLQVLAGYNDNVLQGAFKKDGSPYIGASVEGFFWRTWNEGSRDVYWYILGEELYYTDAADINKERLAILQTRYTFNVGKTLSPGFKLTFTYADEVFDISRSELEIESTTLEFEQFELAPFIRWNLSPKSYLQFEGGAGRYFFRDSSDDYTNPFAGLLYQRTFPFGAKVELGYKTGRKFYDQRSQRDKEGFEIEGTDLQWEWHEATVKWKQAWLSENRLNTETKFSLKLNRDDGVGYSDYDRYKFTQKVSLEKNSWSLTGEFNYSINQYAIQSVDFSNDEAYERRDLSLLVRLTKIISPKLKIFTEWGREESKSNRIEDEFRQNVVYLGLERTF